MVAATTAVKRSPEQPGPAGDAHATEELVAETVGKEDQQRRREHTLVLLAIQFGSGKHGTNRPALLAGDGAQTSDADNA
ncbi:MAG: hypothetical protein KDB14_28270 [Planctomycetales bacterium]|nr:hypothetical protein [Planctomycetales bacterium]